jgi:hypothetical protein
MRVHNAFQNRDENLGPWSETMSTGSPWIRKTCCSMSLAVTLADGSLGRGIKWVALENRSTTVRMVVLPSDGGRPVTVRDSQRLEETSRTLLRSLVLYTNRSSGDECRDVRDHGRPPKASSHKSQGPTGAHVAGKSGGVGPLQDRGADYIYTLSELYT